MCRKSHGNNTMLIYMQKPDATLVAGFNKWKDQFERHVNRGEKGIKIIAPVMVATRQTREKRDPQTHAVILDQQGQAITEEIEVKVPPLPGRFRLRYQPDGWETPAYSGE